MFCLLNNLAPEPFIYNSQFSLLLSLFVYLPFTLSLFPSLFFLSLPFSPLLSFSLSPSLSSLLSFLSLSFCFYLFLSLSLFFFKYPLLFLHLFLFPFFLSLSTPSLDSLSCRILSLFSLRHLSSSL